MSPYSYLLLSSPTKVLKLFKSCINFKTQECIPVGCVPPAAVSVGGSPPGTPLGADTPQSRHPPGADNPPGSRHPPPGADTPQEQITPLGRHPTWEQTPPPPRSRQLPPEQTPLRIRHPPSP